MPPRIRHSHHRNLYLREYAHNSADNALIGDSVVAPGDIGTQFLYINSFSS